MPADDLILNVKQIAGYPSITTAGPHDSVVIQQGGLGGPYASINPEDLVVSALNQSDADIVFQGKLTAFSLQGGSLGFSNGTINQLLASTANIINLSIAGGNINGDPLATQGFVGNTTVSSIDGRRGDVVLGVADIEQAGGAPIYSPVFRGVPQAPTPQWNDVSNQVATTAYVQQAASQQIGYLLNTQPFVFTFNGRSGEVVLTQADVVAADAALLNSPAFTGVPTAPTPPIGDVSNAIATTQFVSNSIVANNTTLLTAVSGQYAPLNNPAFTGVPTAPTAAPGVSSGQIATTAFVMNALSSSIAGVSTWNGRGGNVTMTGADITSAGGALIASPQFTGLPLAPTASVGTNTTQIATTAFVLAELASGSGGVVSSFNSRTGAVVLIGADLSAAGGALLSGPTFTGVPAAPTAAPGTNTTQLATTAFVTAAVSAGTAGVASFNGRTGTVTLNASDLSAAGGLANPSPTLTGTPTAPTAATATSNTQIATTAFVYAVLAAGSVSSFNTRTGAITLTTADITGAGGAPLAGPVFTGAPSAPTASPGTNTAQLATCAFVTAAITAAGGAQPATTPPLMNGTAAVGTSTLFARGDHVHPSDTSLVPLAGGVTITGALGVNGTLTAGGFSTSGTVTGNGWGTFGAINSTAGILALPGIPTTNPGSNQVWNQNGVITIGAGGTVLSSATGGTVSGPVDLKVQAVTAAATTPINRANGENVTLTLGVSITSLTVSGWPASGFTGKLRLVIVSSGAFTIAWPSGTKWAGGTAPTLTSSGTDIVILMTDNAGTTIYGSVVGQAYA